jgi:hypothetical protein
MSNEEVIARKGDTAIRALGELFSNPKAHVYHRYILVRRASGELVFEQEPFDFHVEQAIAKAFGPAEVEKAGDHNRATARRATVNASVRKQSS